MTPKDVVKKWVEAFNACDGAQAASLYHEDASNLQIPIGDPLVGKANIRKDLDDFFKHIPDNFTKIENLFQDGEWAILEWSGGGTFFADGSQEGKQFTLKGCGFFHVRNGKILFQRGYWDKATWFKQVGLPV